MAPSLRPDLASGPLTTERLLTQLGLGPEWSLALEAELTANVVARHDNAWDGDAVTAWRRRTLARSDFLTVREYRLVAMRLASFSPAVIRERAHARADNATLHRLGLTVALRYTHDLAPLHPGRAGQRLVDAGLGWRGEPPHILRRAAKQLWLAGASRNDIASNCGLGQAAVARIIESLPARITSGMVSTRFGWSSDNIFQKLNRGTFPPPDGTEGPHGHTRWWWVATIDLWESQRNLVPCPQCGARVERLAVHQRTHA